ncbi:MAG TPA: alpha/beta hydrolase [Acidimicrobiales bacterium]|nr:alpha/beta hydrolase [Acidimicrobiales bacterium]
MPWWAKLLTIMAPSRRTDLEVIERGSGDQLVVFVHGVLDGGQSFGRVAALLEGECRMVWYDRRGYGRSLRAPGVPVGVDVHVEDLLRVIDERRAVVVGHSFGGVTVVGAALQAPELVGAVVLYETGMAWAPGWDDSHMREVLWSEDPAKAGVQMMFRERFDAMAADQREIRLLEGRAFVAEERSVRTGTPPFDLSALQVPLVYGCSNRTDWSAVPRYLAEVAGAEIVELPGAGHNAHRTQPGPFADLVRRGMALAAARGER